MMLTNKALWTIERNLNRPLTLREIAEACGVSPFHLAHAFGRAAGVSVLHYVRGRRLSAAAETLAASAPDILDLALETGYGSHEAFSRAFRAEFGATPETVKRKGSTEGLTMVKALKIMEKASATLEPPRIVEGAPMRLVGLAGRHAFAAPQDIPAQWRRFMESYGEIPDRAARIPVGVTTNMDDDGNFEYFCAVEVSKFSTIPPGLSQLRVPAQTYAVFLHRGHVAEIGATYAAIWNDWSPGDGRAVGEGPSLERHCETFDPRTGLGGVEIWLPVKEEA
jgi:AraC family transcriptional regulator